MMLRSNNKKNKNINELEIEYENRWAENYRTWEQRFFERRRRFEEQKQLRRNKRSKYDYMSS